MIQILINYGGKRVAIIVCNGNLVTIKMALFFTLITIFSGVVALAGGGKAGNGEKIGKNTDIVVSGTGIAELLGKIDRQDKNSFSARN